VGDVVRRGDADTVVREAMRLLALATSCPEHDQGHAEQGDHLPHSTTPLKQARV